MVGAVLLVARYSELPDVIPAYRTPLGAPMHPLRKGPFSVFRIVAMGIGQLGAATVMMHSLQQFPLQHWQGPPMILVRPKVAHIGWFTFGRTGELIEEGFVAPLPTGLKRYWTPLRLTPIDGGKAGGLARVATIAGELRASGRTVVTTMSGDFLSPSVASRSAAATSS